MKRRAFATACAAAAALPARALASGGLDDGDLRGPRASGDVVRILLAQGVPAGSLPARVDAATFTFRGHRYRGSFALLQGNDDRYAVLNIIPFEQYLYGVVGSEIPSGWPQAALEAQAVVARTFAFSRRKSGRAYDLVDSEIDQAYGGRDSETAVGAAAVEATSQTVVTFADLPASVYFMSCCGGHTVDAAAAWGGAGAPYLRGVVDPYCSGAPEYRWTRSLPWETANAALALRLRALGELQTVRIAAADDAGRAQRIAFDGSLGSVILTPAELRTALGAQYVRSAMVRTVNVSPQAPRMLTIEGEGRGHGVGMCQWGARAMAAQGAAMREIIAWYFPGTALGRLPAL